MKRLKMKFDKIMKEPFIDISNKPPFQKTSVGSVNSVVKNPVYSVDPA